MLLEIKKLNKKFGSVVAAENINFSMSEKGYWSNRVKWCRKNNIL